jgi:hypothetical protein
LGRFGLAPDRPRAASVHFREEEVGGVPAAVADVEVEVEVWQERA